MVIFSLGFPTNADLMVVEWDLMERNGIYWNLMDLNLN